MSESSSKSVRASSLDTTFGSNEVRLSITQWLIAIALISCCFVAIPRLWRWVEVFDPPPDYRIPFALSDDYWHFERWMDQVAAADRIPIIGDSVIWGEYVTPDETFSEFINEQLEMKQFANAGLNGSHPLALEGLVDHYCNTFKNDRLVVHCNLLWMSSPERDLQSSKEVSFNHSRLVPQLFRKIPSYKASTDDRIGNAIDHRLAFRGLVHHWRIAHFESLDLHSWSLEHPYENPATVVSRPIPTASRLPRHEEISWTERGIEKQEFPWVEPTASLQLQSFRRTIAKLTARGNRVFVVIGPFNEHLLLPESVITYAALKDHVVRWLDDERIPHIVPELLPSDEYGDASHPLAAGYRRLAAEIAADVGFQDWLLKSEVRGER